jgi:hypothetical protein
MARKRWSRWSGGWSIHKADAAYRLIKSAGEGNAAAKAELDAITSAAAEKDPVAVRVMTYFTPIAKMVEKNIGPPSKLREKQEFEASLKVYKDKIAALEEAKTPYLVSDARVERIDGQIAAYQAVIASMEDERAGLAWDVKSPMDTHPESAEGEAEMIDEEYPTGAQGGAPGDIEFTEN